MVNIITQDTIEKKIHHIREKKVMLDKDLAELYGVTVKALNQAVKRNIERFPDDFMFQLSIEEAEHSRSQFVTLKQGQNIKYRPFAFTEQGIAMLSSVLHSKRAVLVNIQIMRIFIKLREVLRSHAELQQKINEIISVYGTKLNEHDENFKLVFEAINQLLDPPDDSAKKKFGFR